VSGDPMPRRSRFRGESVIVTGAAAGLGRAITAAFLAEGATVVVSDRDSAALRSMARACSDGAEGSVLAVECDVRDTRQVAELVETAERQCGPVGVLVNNAGVSSVASVLELSERQWDECMDVNAKGVFLCCQAILPRMLERKAGSIVTIASQEAKRGSPYIAHYCASKAAVIGFTRGLAVECAPHVRVNAVCPGVIETEMVRRTLKRLAEITGRDQEQIRSSWLDAIPLGRFQDPAQIAASVLFLASDDASEITGQALNVSGGTILE
jgi:NAD(P)-dependent dehydrogenase (short-subunit alcohol dehydrogenase family)